MTEHPTPDPIENLRHHYQKCTDDLGNDFFAPCLSKCIHYQRASGYFTSHSLVAWAGAIRRLIQEQNVKIDLLISPNLEADDIQALRRAQNALETADLQDTISDRLVGSAIDEMLKNPSSRARLDLLTWLIVNRHLTLRFAFAKDPSDGSLYHEKYGIFTFADGRHVAFTGSANETMGGHQRNHESIDVYRSWNDGDLMRVQTKIKQFDNQWQPGAQSGLEVRELSPAIFDRIIELAPSQKPANDGTDEPQTGEPADKADKPSLWRHQQRAFDLFLEAKHGVLEMATGTGKTRTALALATHALTAQNVDRIIVTTAGRALLNQWYYELRDWHWGLQQTPLIRRHYGPNREMQRFASGLDRPGVQILVIRRAKLIDFFALANDLMSGSNWQKKTMIIHDEVHGLGSPSLVAGFAGQQNDLAYRLGLSATPEREYDDAGSAFIRREVGPIIFEYDLGNAISDGILCPFVYEPLGYEFTSDDKRRQREVFAKKAARESEGLAMSNDELYRLLSNIRKTAEQKPWIFAKYLNNNPDILASGCIIFVHTKAQGEQLLNTIHRHQHRFHTFFDSDSTDVLEAFANDQLGCLVTCHRLSEGIDIKHVSNIVLMSSDRAKLETIQRIGRALRSDPSKPQKRARVIDFIRTDSTSEHDDADHTRKQWLTALSKMRREPDHER